MNDWGFWVQMSSLALYAAADMLKNNGWTDKEECYGIMWNTRVVSFVQLSHWKFTKASAGMPMLLYYSLPLVLTSVFVSSSPTSVSVSFVLFSLPCSGVYGTIWLSSISWCYFPFPFVLFLLLFVFAVCLAGIWVVYLTRSYDMAKTWCGNWTIRVHCSLRFI